jgi:hypothetical protein
MGKPLVKHFNAWFGFESQQPMIQHWHGLKPILDATKSTTINSATREQIRSAMLLAVDSWSEAQSSARSTSLMRWAEAQPSYVRALRVLTGARGRRRAKGHGSIDTFLSKLEIDQGYDRWQGVREFFERQIGDTWDAQFFHALHELLYTDTASQLLALSKDGPRAFERLRNAAMEALPLIQLHGEESGDSIVGMVERLPRHLDRITWKLRSLPIQRDALHKAEHLYVYRLWRINQQYFRSAKPDCIAELMFLDGVAHQFDVRTIERMCAKFKTARFGRFRPKVAVANIDPEVKPTAATKASPKR